MNITLIRLHSMHALALLLALVAIATAADQARVRAVLQPATERRPAPEFTLKDSSGETGKLSDYRGKVVLLDFWATWCEGCRGDPLVLRIPENKWDEILSSFRCFDGRRRLAGGETVSRRDPRTLPNITRRRCDSAALRNPEPARHISH